MSNDRSRRDFLKFAAAISAVAGVDPVAVAKPAIQATARTSEPISIFVTDSTRHFAHAGSLQWNAARSTESMPEIAVDSSKRFQPILGFGAAFTDAACYTFFRMPTADRGKLFHELFDPARMNLSVARICVGSSDYSVRAYSFDEGAPDPDLARFSIDHDREYILPILREARAVNPSLFLLASPWSPPGWMKDNESMLGGTIRRRYLSTYALYLARFLNAYKEAGAHVDALTPQNEVDTDQDGRMPACTWPQEVEVEFVGRYLGPELQKAGLDTKIWLIDHNYNLWGRAIAELDDEGVSRHTNAIAWHGYVGTPDLIGRVHVAHPTAEMFWTEGGPDYTSPTYATDWCSWGKTFTGILRHWCRCIIGWNYALDEKGRPNIGPFSCGGLVTVGSQSKVVSYSGQYHAMTHFSRSFARGAIRISSEGDTGLEHVAADLNGETTLVLTNPGPRHSVGIRVGDRRTTVELPADSLVTLRWRQS